MTRSFPIPLFEEEFWAIQQESCPRKEKVRNAFEIKNYRKNPARFFEEKLTDFSLFHTTTPADLELVSEICNPKKEHIIVNPKKEHIIADHKKEDILAEDVIAELRAVEKHTLRA